MSRKTSTPQKIIFHDRGVQTYRTCDKGFTDSIRTTTFEEVRNNPADRRVVRESEFAKPYGEQYEELPEDYSGMEYEIPGTPPWGWDYPDMVPRGEEPYHVTFYCGGSICWCEENEKTINAKCGWEIVNAEFKPAFPDVTLSFGPNSITTYGEVGVSGTGYLTITMKAVFESGGEQQVVYGTHSGKAVPECSTEICDCNDDEIAWDHVLSATTVAQSGSADVYIEDPPDTGGPFFWSLSGDGEGFSLDETETVGLMNTVNATATACGGMDITVKGCDGREVTGRIRCPDSGFWDDIADPAPDPCLIPGPFTGIVGNPNADVFERIEGQYKVVQDFQFCEGHVNRGCDEWQAIYDPLHACIEPIGSNCSWWPICITYDDDIAVATSGDNPCVVCNDTPGRWKQCWPGKTDCAAIYVPPDSEGCVCIDTTIYILYEWVCPFVP